MLRLEAIKFNHDSSSANVDAFNIRKDKQNFVEVPEWRRGLSFNPEDSPAAYSLFDTRGNTLTIRAIFSCDNRRSRTIEVRALDARLYPRASGNSPLSHLADRLLGLILDDSKGNILGEVKAKRIKLCNGKSEFETFRLKNVRIWEGGVAVQDIVWRWQYRLFHSGSWTDFATSKHRIYTTLSRPREPWQQSPYERSNLQLPWTAVLEYACRWAAGAQNPTDAASRVTHSVYRLGQDGIASYYKSSQYTVGGVFNMFNCAAFLFDLKLGAMKLNCTDCATVVSSFANLLGNELWQSEMTGFDYNPIIKIGECLWLDGHFDSHAVAWEEDCDVHNNVFDACLQIDGDRNPTASDRYHVPLLATDLRFGRPKENLYRDRLVAPTNTTAAATPLPCLRTRRLIQTLIPIQRPVCDELLVLAARRFDFTGSRYELTEIKPFSTKGLLDPFLAGWTELRSDQLTTIDKEVYSETLWRSSDRGPDALVLIRMYEGSSLAAARELLHHSIASLHSFDGVRQEQTDLADAYFMLDEDVGVIFWVSNVVASLVNVRKGGVSINAIAHDLLQKIVANPKGSMKQHSTHFRENPHANEN